jgi:multidrug efflux pump subunit AcrB
VDRANSQVVALSGFILRSLPPAIQPPEIINFSASSVPVLQLGVSGPGLSEQQLNDLALNFLRTQLITVPGAVIPLPYGGKPRQVMINMDQNLMQAKNVSPSDVLNSVNAQNLILPSGTAKIAESELDVRVNVTPRTVSELGDLPIKQVGAKTIYLRDVSRVSDGFGLQTNVVRQDGHRGVLVSVLKAGTASTPCRSCGRLFRGPERRRPGETSERYRKSVYRSVAVDAKSLRGRGGAKIGCRAGADAA